LDIVFECLSGDKKKKKKGKRTKRWI